MMTTIRSARQDDLDQIFSLAQRFATSFVPDRGAFESSFIQLIAEPHAALLAAEESGEVCAYLLGFDHATLYANGRVAWVEEIMVREDQRRRGIGQRLMEHFESWARSRNAKLVALATRRAASFYSGLGYEESATYYRKLL